MSDFVIPTITPGMTPDEIIDAFGGEERAYKALRYGQYMFEQPALCRRNLIELSRYLMPDPDDPYNSEKSRYQVAVHHNLIAESLTEVIDGRCLKLALSIPPQHGKSQLAKTFLAEHVGLFPWKHLMMGTYNSDFAKEYGDDVRGIINTEEYGRVYPEVHLRTGSKSKDHMVTTDGGKLSFLGRGGSGTGRPADGFLVDDPLKDAAEASSKAIRDASWQWFTRVANTRCHALSWQVIIMTRWSDDDIIARLTDPKNPHYNADVAKQWKVINVPAILDDEELARALGKRVGEALWPERFPLELLETARKMDPLGFSALYMGRPTPPEGSFYKQADIYEYHSPQQFPKHCRTYLTSDLAVSPERYSDSSVGGVWGLDEHGVLWLHPDIYWDKKASDESVDTLIDMGKRYHVLEAWFEKGQLDRAIGPFLEKRMEELTAYFSISRLPVAGNKGLRSQSIRGLMRQGKVRFPSFAPWWPAAKEQLLKFTGSGDDKADDFCDMIALIGQAVEGMVRGSVPQSNVIQMPKVGTLAWTKWAHTQQRRQEQRAARLRGM